MNKIFYIFFPIILLGCTNISPEKKEANFIKGIALSARECSFKFKIDKDFFYDDTKASSCIEKVADKCSNIHDNILSKKCYSTIDNNYIK